MSGMDSSVKLHLAEPHFADAFARATQEQWRGLVGRVLNGALFDSLQSRTADGILVEPLYAASPAGARALRKTSGDWRIAARIDHGDPVEANHQLLIDLEGGANAVHLVFTGAAGAGGFGLPAHRQAVEAALDGVAPELGLCFELETSAESIPAAAWVAAHFEARGIDPASASISFGFDPLSQIARGGDAPAQWPELAKAIGVAAYDLLQRGFSGRFCVGDGRCVHASGGSEAQELAFTLASALAYWRALEAAGVNADAARGMLSFRLAADADEFATLSKFRALRRLWARIEEASGLTPQPIHIHAETARRMMSRRDPHVNLLRATTACFSAGLGGADVVSVLPFTQAIGLPDAAARRLARNTQLVLLQEAHLGVVADPAAGAGVFEALTDALCERAWALLQVTEAAGGMFVALTSGAFAAEVAAVREARCKTIATRAALITGVSEFPDLAEIAAPVLQTAPPEVAIAGARFATLAPMRDAERFEALRDAADAKAQRDGRPVVFLASLGALPEFAARVGLARNFFAVGGIASSGGEAYADDAALVQGFRASGAKIVCLCSTDDLYAQRGLAVVAALEAAGAAQVWLVGRPDATAAPVTGYIFAGCDAIDILTKVQASF